MKNEKQVAGEKAAEFVKDGMVVGLGTGSTVLYTIKKIGERVKDGLSITAVATSIQTEQLAKECGIPLVNLADIDVIDVAIDGADEVDAAFNLIKGGGGALLREKIIASSAQEFIIVADSSKMVKQLGRFPIPVEVEIFGYPLTGKKIQSIGGVPKLRMNEGKPFVTDNGNYIFDCDFAAISSPEKLELNLNLIPGIVENGLFIGLVDLLITVDQKQEAVIQKRNEDG
ncbi:ribose-5-phosphate isomerase RpiA [Domibacillus iocasae]|uniref:Ribose-5-phosphate isomerase A n=1 Tax=Domibacillus iocasae TaxID=1714016 RepID=A0A1E7DTI9_9BACI|nr:ribose-5-phosphate isomerase RpiA [Domibacillus iocasae]OES46403.1 ribose 5-phosphate isomerase A [Domibacillus iocasae]